VRHFHIQLRTPLIEGTHREDSDDVDDDNKPVWPTRAVNDDDGSVWPTRAGGVPGM